MSTQPYPPPEIMFQMQYESVRRDEVIGVLLAFFLGCFGVHHFYLRRTGMGILYLCFCWTGIPAILGVIECFFMPGRVRMFNALQAAAIATALGIPVPAYVSYPGWTVPGGGAGYPAAVPGSPMPGAGAPQQAIVASLVACGNCGHANVAGARFCAGCGQPLA